MAVLAVFKGSQSQCKYCLMVYKQLCTDFDNSETASPVLGSLSRLHRSLLACWDFIWIYIYMDFVGSFIGMMI